MSQVTDYTFDPNVARNAFQSPLEAVFAAIRSLNSGVSEPDNPVPGMLWLDTSVSPPAVRIRNAADTGWIEILRLTTASGAERVIDPTIMRAGTGAAQVRDNSGLDARYLQIADERGVYSYGDAVDGYLFHKVSPTKAIGWQWVTLPGAGGTVRAATWPITFSLIYRAHVDIGGINTGGGAISGMRLSCLTSISGSSIEAICRAWDGSGTSASARAFGIGEITI